MKKIINHIFELNRVSKISIQILFDGFLIFFSFILSWYLRLDQTFYSYISEIWIFLIILLPTTLGIFFKLSFYKNIVRFISISFVKTAFLGSLISASLIYVTSYVVNLYLPRSIPLIYLLILLPTICGIRFQLSFLYYFYINKKRNKIAIIGTGSNGVKLAALMNQDDNNKLIAFFDNKKSIIGSKISGVVVYDLELIEKIILEENINSILISDQNISNKLNQNLLSYIEKFNIEVKKAPNLDEFTNYYTSVKLKDISIEDILGRKPIKSNPKLLDKDIKNKIILVTGAGGSIGSQLCMQIIKVKPKILILLELSEYNLYTINNDLMGYKLKHKSNIEIIPIIGSIQNKNQLNKIFKLFNINTVYHAAAYKHVPLIEMNIFEGIKNNIYGTKILVELSVKNKVKKFILISSDKAVRPTNYMGATKRVAEILCLLENKKQKNTTFSIVRFGNVLESSGSVVPLFKKQILNGGPVTVTDPEIERYFMTIQEASELVIQAGSMAKIDGEIFILDMGKRMKILKLAEQMIRLNGNIPIINKKDGSKASSKHIFIEFIGLRPGEKLIEELVYKTKIVKTEHPRIMKTKDSLKSVLDAEKNITKLILSCENNDFSETINLIKKIDHSFNFSQTTNDIFQN